MSIPTLDTDLSIIQKLDDYPNDIGGLSAAQLKAKFDEGVLALQTYINTVLIPALIASNVSFTPTAAINAETVQAAIENVQAQLAGISAGTIPNNTVGMEKLTKTVQNAIASGGGAAAAVTALSETVAQNVAATNENTTAIAAINTANVNRDAEIAKIGDKAEKSQGATFVLTVAGWADGKQTVAIMDSSTLIAFPRPSASTRRRRWRSGRRRQSAASRSTARTRRASPSPARPCRRSTCRARIS